jgi:hypothetical protein
MPCIEIIPAVADHVRALGISMRAADQAEIRGFGLVPHRTLWVSYRHSLMRRTALVDGEVAAMWGVTGAPLGRAGRPWLLTGPACDRVSPIRFARIYRDEAVSMLGLFPALENIVDSSYYGAVRMLCLAGFTVHDPVPMGVDGKCYSRFEMRVREAAECL